MNIVTESHISGQPIGDKQRKRPVRMVRWFIIVGLLLALLVGGLVYFNYFRGKMIAQFFATNKPPPASVSVATANSETIPNLLIAVGDLAAVHQVNVTSDVNGRITDIMFTAGASVKAGTPLVQLFDGPEQGDLAIFKAQATMAQLSLDRAKQLASRQFGPQGTVGVRSGQCRYLQDRSHHLAEAGAGAVRRRTRRAQGRGGTISDGGNADRFANRPGSALCEFHRDGKGLWQPEGRPDRSHRGRCLSGPQVRRQDLDHRAADRDRHAQYSRAGDD